MDVASGATIVRLDCFDALAAGADHRLDELAVGISVAAIDELRQRQRAIGSFVVDAGEIERTDRIVRRPDDEEPGEAAVELLQDVAKAGSLEAAKLLAGAAPQNRRVRP